MNQVDYISGYFMQARETGFVSVIPDLTRDPVRSPDCRSSTGMTNELDSRLRGNDDPNRLRGSTYWKQE